MALLPTALLVRRLPQAADADRLLQPVAGRRLAAVAAVQPKPAFQLGNARHKQRDLGAQQCILGLQRGYNRLATSRGRCVLAGERAFGPCHRHVDSYQPVTCQGPPIETPTWAVTGILSCAGIPPRDSVAMIFCI